MSRLPFTRGTVGGVELLGFRNVDRMLTELPRVTQRKVMRQGIRAGGKVFLAAAKANAPVRSGLLRKRIKLRVAKARRGEYRMRVMTGTREEMGIPADSPSYYPAHVEHGHAIVTHDGVMVGMQPPQPYMRPAFDEKKAEAEAVSVKTMIDGIEREAKALAGKVAA